MKTITYKGEDYTIPFQIVCTVSGSVKTYTAQEFIESKIDKAGSLKVLRDTYVCRDAARLLKEGKSAEEIKKLLTNGEVVEFKKPAKAARIKPAAVEMTMDTPPPRESMVVITEAPKPLTKEQSNADTCYNPSWLLDGKACQYCAMVSICTYKDSPRGKLLLAKKQK